MARTPKYPNLAAEMARVGLGLCDMAAAIGCNYNAAYRRFYGVSQTTVGEAAKVRDALFPEKTIDFLFAERG